MNALTFRTAEPILQHAVRTRLGSCGLKDLWPSLIDHVQSRMPSNGPDAYSPSLKCNDLKKMTTGNSIPPVVTVWRTHTPEIRLLERALAYLVWSEKEQGSSANRLRSHAWRHCELADQERAKRANAMRAGSLKRHAKNDAVKHLIADALIANPELYSGRSMRQAALKLQPAAALLISQRRLSMSQGDSLVRTISRWLKIDPQLSVCFKAIQ